jgi:hypothetical protein
VISESLAESTNVTSRLYDFVKNNPNVYLTMLWEKELQITPSSIPVKSEDEYPPQLAHHPRMLRISASIEKFQKHMKAFKSEKSLVLRLPSEMVRAGFISKQKATKLD